MFRPRFPNEQAQMESADGFCASSVLICGEICGIHLNMVQYNNNKQSFFYGVLLMQFPFGSVGEDSD